MAAAGGAGGAAAGVQKIPIVYAAAVISGDMVKGELVFEQETKDGPTRIMGEIRGLPEGEHKLVVCSFGDLSAVPTSLGDIFHPHDDMKGLKSSTRRFIGELGELVANADGVATFGSTDRLIALIGPYSVIGRSLAVQTTADIGGEGDAVTGPVARKLHTLGAGVIGIAHAGLARDRTRK